MSDESANAPHSRINVEKNSMMTPEGVDAEFSRLLERYVHMDPDARAIARRQFAERILEGSDRVPEDDAAPQDVYSYTLHYPKDDVEKRRKKWETKKLQKLRRMDEERREMKKLRELVREEKKRLSPPSKKDAAKASNRFKSRSPQDKQKQTAQQKARSLTSIYR